MVFNLNTTTTATCVKIYGRKMKSLREWRCNCRDSTAYTWNILSAHPTQYSPHIAESAVIQLSSLSSTTNDDVISSHSSHLTTKRTNAPAGQSTDRSWTEERIRQSPIYCEPTTSWCWIDESGMYFYFQWPISFSFARSGSNSEGGCCEK